MKYNVNKYQDGGGISFTPILNTPPTVGSSKSTSNSKESSDSILDDDIFKELVKKGGLVNDVNDLVGKLMKLESSQSNPFLKSSNRISSLKMISEINTLRQNKSLWDGAMQTSKASGGLSEVAVGNYGELYTKDEKGFIKTISSQDYVKSKDKVKLLSVSELLNERQYNPQLTNQNQIFNVANNAIGLNKITDHIKGLISALGNESQSESKFYSKEKIANQFAQLAGGKKPTNDEIKSMMDLKSILETPGEYYKIKSETSTERNHGKEAINYIWKTLGQNAQAKLTATAAINGESDPRKFILDMVVSQTDVKTSTEVSPEKIPEQTTDKNGNPKNIALNPAELFHRGLLNQENNDYFVNNNKGSKIKIHASSKGNLLELKDNRPIGVSTLSDAMVKSGLSMILDTNKAFLGDQKISPAELQNLVYGGQEDVARVFLPVKSDGTPDLESMQEFNDIMTVYEANKDKESLKASEKRFSDAGFNVKIEQIQGTDGKMVKVIKDNKFVKPFLAIPTLTNSATDFADNPWLVKLKGNEGDMATKVMESAWTTVGGTSSKPKIKNNTPTGYFSLERPLSGVTYIAYRPEATAILTSMNDHLYGTAPSITDVQRNLNYSSNQPNASSVNGSAKLLIQ